LYCSKQRAEIGLQWYFADTDGGVMMMVVVVVVVVGVTG